MIIVPQNAAGGVQGHSKAVDCHKQALRMALLLGDHLQWRCTRVKAHIEKSMLQQETYP